MGKCASQVNEQFFASRPRLALKELHNHNAFMTSKGGNRKREVVMMHKAALDLMGHRNSHGSHVSFADKPNVVRCGGSESRTI